MQVTKYCPRCDDRTFHDTTMPEREVAGRRSIVMHYECKTCGHAREKEDEIFRDGTDQQIYN